MGKDNTGINNSGDRNSGDWNSGDWNSGDWNSGNRNSGYRNSGDWNSGNRNSGDWNSGNWNSGGWNSGNRNSGGWNSGNRNSGYWNSGDWNSGMFNRDSPKMRLFEKDLDMTVEEFYGTHNIYMRLPLNRWIDKTDMTAEEKEGTDSWKTTGGILRTLDYKEAHRVWWSENTDDHERFLNLPGFDWEIFTEITGIEKDTGKEESIEIEGKKYTLDEIKKALGK